MNLDNRQPTTASPAMRTTLRRFSSAKKLRSLILGARVWRAQLCLQYFPIFRSLAPRRAACRLGADIAQVGDELQFFRPHDSAKRARIEKIRPNPWWVLLSNFALGK